MTLRLPDPAPAWMSQLAGVLSERDARLREGQAKPTADDHDAARTQSRIAHWLADTGRAAVHRLENRFSILSAGYRLASRTNLNAGSLDLTLTQNGAPIMDYRFTLEATPAGVRPSVSTRHGGDGRRQRRAFRARLAGETDLAGISADDLASDFTAALAEGESRG